MLRNRDSPVLAPEFLRDLRSRASGEKDGMSLTAEDIGSVPKVLLHDHLDGVLAGSV
jgi:hypothetical protein